MIIWVTTAVVDLYDVVSLPNFGKLTGGGWRNVYMWGFGIMSESGVVHFSKRSWTKLSYIAFLFKSTTQLVQIWSALPWFVPTRHSLCKFDLHFHDSFLGHCPRWWHSCMILLSGYLHATSVPYRGAVAFLFHMNDKGSDHLRPFLLSYWSTIGI